MPAPLRYELPYLDVVLLAGALLVGAHGVAVERARLPRAAPRAGRLSRPRRRTRARCRSGPSRRPSSRLPRRPARPRRAPGRPWSRRRSWMRAAGPAGSAEGRCRMVRRQAASSLDPSTVSISQQAARSSSGSFPNSSWDRPGSCPVVFFGAPRPRFL